MGRIADLSKKDRDQIRICTVAKNRLQQSHVFRTRPQDAGYTLDDVVVPPCQLRRDPLMHAASLPFRD